MNRRETNPPCVDEFTFDHTYVRIGIDGLLTINKIVMPYYLRFMLYDRWPQPYYKPLGADTLVDETLMYEQGKVYRFRLAGSTDEVATWPEFVVVKTASHKEQQTTLVEVFVVLLSEYEQFVEPFQDWELN